MDSANDLLARVERAAFLEGQAAHRKRISIATRAALADRQRNGVKLGRPRCLADRVVERIRTARDEGATLAAIANELNRDGIPTAQGGVRWYPSTVRAVLRYSDERNTA